ncbi:MAG: S1-like domain-containing RNA-binding protein [Bacteroidota bacterium]|nr:S1-like domain-containing RNA-binding protein [Bacteroidota bacterium]
MDIGKYNTLEVVRKTSVGFYLTDGVTEVLLPKKYITDKIQLGYKDAFFVYKDHQHRWIATTQKPYALKGTFAYLKVSYTNKYGAFLEWGVEKDLFVPFAEQLHPMERNKKYVVYIFEDKKTERLVASSKINKFIEHDNIELEANQPVELMILNATDLGFNVLIDGKYKGLLYQNEVFRTLRIGDRLEGYIKQIRLDKKIDVSLRPVGVEAVQDDTNRILEELRQNGGFLRLSDNSHPEEIKSVLEMSKKSFKRAIGSLYKDRIIDIKEDGIYLLEK